MRPWSLRAKIIVLLVGLVTGSILVASAIHGWFAFRALREDVRSRAAGIASQMAFGISTPQELGNRDLLATEIRNTMTARPTIRWLEVYAEDPSGLRLVVSSRQPGPSQAPALAAQAFEQGRTLTAAGRMDLDEIWLAAAPIYIGQAKAGSVILALSQEGADRLASSLLEQLLFVLVGAGATIVAALTFFTERSINRPIRLLLQTMRAVEGGDLSASPPFVRRDEMGQLAEGFVRMLRRIRESHGENVLLLERINRFNQELQARVTEATQELTERNEALRRAQELLFDLQRQLGRAQRLATLGQLTAKIAHEIGTPLNSIALHLQLLARSSALTEQDRQRLVTIDGQIQRLVMTIRGLLTATRGGGQRLERIDLNRLVRGVTDLLRPVLASKRIFCSIEAADGLPEIQADRHQLQQVLLNLLTNAVDAMPDGGSLRVSTGLVDGMAYLRVADSGPGVPPTDRTRIFEPFYTTKDQAGGTGLGLAVCRQLVEAHRGSVEVTDTPGGGATFEVRLPLPVKETDP